MGELEVFLIPLIWLAILATPFVIIGVGFFVYRVVSVVGGGAMEVVGNFLYVAKEKANAKIQTWANN